MPALRCRRAGRCGLGHGRFYGLSNLDGGGDGGLDFGFEGVRYGLA